MLLPEDVRFVKLQNGKTHVFLSERGIEPEHKHHYKDILVPAKTRIVTFCGETGYLKSYIPGTAATIPVPGWKLSRNGKHKIPEKPTVSCVRCTAILGSLRAGWGMS